MTIFALADIIPCIPCIFNPKHLKKTLLRMYLSTFSLNSTAILKSVG